MTIQTATAKVLTALLRSDARSATAFLSDTLTVRASRILYGRRLPRRGQPVDVRLTIGRPNYEARRFIRQAKRVGEPFPIKKVHLRFLAASSP